MVPRTVRKWASLSRGDMVSCAVIDCIKHDVALFLLVPADLCWSADLATWWRAAAPLVRVPFNDSLGELQGAVLSMQELNCARYLCTVTCYICLGWHQRAHWIIPVSTTLGNFNCTLTQTGYTSPLINTVWHTNKLTAIVLSNTTWHKVSKWLHLFGGDTAWHTDPNLIILDNTTWHTDSNFLHHLALKFVRTVSWATPLGVLIQTFYNG